jgi:hypothetical protein
LRQYWPQKKTQRQSNRVPVHVLPPVAVAELCPLF